MEISNEDMKILLKSQQGELDAVLMYNALAEVAKGQKDKDSENFSMKKKFLKLSSLKDE